jgi:hypothetical protein
MHNIRSGCVYTQITIHIDTFTAVHKCIGYDGISDQGAAQAFLQGTWLPPPDATSILPISSKQMGMKELDPERMISEARKVYTYWQNDDIEGLLSLFTEDVIVMDGIMDTPKISPWQCHLKGKDGKSCMPTHVMS